MTLRPYRRNLQQLADGLASDLSGGLLATWSPFAPSLRAAALLPALRVQSALGCHRPEESRSRWASARQAADALHGMLDLARRCGLVDDELPSRAACLRDALGAMSGQGPVAAGMRI